MFEKMTSEAYLRGNLHSSAHFLVSFELKRLIYWEITDKYQARGL